MKGYFEKRGQARLDGDFDECWCIFEKDRDALLSPAEGILGHMVTVSVAYGQGARLITTPDSLYGHIRQIFHLNLLFFFFTLSVILFWSL